MSVDDLIAALDLPLSSRLDTRVPKKLLLENGAPTSTDKRIINDGIEELTWVAALKPTSIGVPEYVDENREYLEIAVVRLLLRPTTRPHRIIELVHRAIPYPIVLISTTQDKQIHLSLAHLRRSLAVKTASVIDGPVRTLIIGDHDIPYMNTWRTLLPLACQPHTSLQSVYQGWMDACTALEVARITGICVLPSTDCRAVLDTYHRLAAEETRLRTLAGKERQIARRVELNLACQNLQKQRMSLFGIPPGIAAVPAAGALNTKTEERARRPRSQEIQESQIQESQP